MEDWVADIISASTATQQIMAYNYDSEQAVCQWEVHEECKAQMRPVALAKRFNMYVQHGWLEEHNLVILLKNNLITV